MTRRLFPLVSAVSAAMAALTLLLSACSFRLDPRESRLSLGPACHIGVCQRIGGNSLGRLVLFSDGKYGPYRGSLIALSDGKGGSMPPIDRRVSWGDSCGIYFRYWRWANGPAVWTLTVSLWYPLLLSAVLPAFCVGRRARFRRLVQST
jgi:hypothetical protein